MGIAEQFKNSFLFKGNNKSVETQLMDMYKKLSDIEEIKNLQDNPGWIRLANSGVETVRQLIDTIDRLATDPVKNEKQIVFAKANKDAIIAFLSVVEGAQSSFRALLTQIDDKYQQVEETAMQGIPIK